MTTRVNFLFLILFSILVKGQTQNKNFELGTTLVTVNSTIGKDFFGGNIAPNEPGVAFVDGIFFRYSHKHIGLRALCSFTKYEKNLFGYSSGHLIYKDFKIGVGGQYSILKDADWIYTFIDAAYNRVHWSGSIFGDTPNDMYSYSAYINGLDVFFGFGFKLKMFKIVSVSPELSYDFFTGQENNYRTSLITKQTVNNNYKLTGNHPVFKIHVNYIF